MNHSSDYFSGTLNRVNGNYGVIAGGAHNTVSGACSAILGGCGNTVTHDYAAVFGHNLVSCANDMFHVSCLNAVNTPVNTTAGLTVGTVNWVLAPGILGLPAGTKLLLIK
jgi:hypothetical protein